jgi:hypothetical protein
VGDRKNTRVDQRILHLDVAAAALKLVCVPPTWLETAACLKFIGRHAVHHQSCRWLVWGNQGVLCHTHRLCVHTAYKYPCVNSKLMYPICLCTAPGGTY